MQTVVTSVSDSERPTDATIPAQMRGINAAPTDAKSMPLDSELRQTMRAEIECMARFYISNGVPIDADILDSLAAIDAGQTINLGDMIQTHQSLSALSDVKPNTIRMILEAGNGGAISGILGPTPAVRRLTVATLLFAAAFFATSLSGNVNVETMHSSIYELDGAMLAIKLLLITSAAGLGAGFAVLFDVWRDLKQYRFDPMSESANWMQLGLGVIAGLVLSEIVASDHVLSGTGPTSDGDLMMMSGPLLALVGGFSATILHLLLKNLVDAFKRVLDPGDSERSPDVLKRARAASLPAAAANDPVAGVQNRQDAPPRT